MLHLPGNLGEGGDVAAYEAQPVHQAQGLSDAAGLAQDGDELALVEGVAAVGRVNVSPRPSQ